MCSRLPCPECAVSLSFTVFSLLFVFPVDSIHFWSFHTQAHTDTHVQAYIAHVRTHAHTQNRPCTHLNAQVYAHMNIQTHTYAHTLKPIKCTHAPCLVFSSPLLFLPLTWLLGFAEGVAFLVLSFVHQDELLVCSVVLAE